MYEKFCYLNDYSEKALSDSENTKFLLKYGFAF